MRAVDVLALDVELTSRWPVLLLREQDAPYRVLPMFVGANEARSIVLALRGVSPPRPFAHDLLAALIDCVGAHVDHVEVTALHEGTFIAELALSGPGGERWLDSRPSDAIALALRVHAPLFVSEAVLDEAGALVPGPSDQGKIDEDVSRFRAFLDEVSPAQFEGAGGVGDGPGEEPDEDPDS
ncbi:MAG TPA: bifunctional nuclease family protein [Acidimicrobiales bacterium]|nr:bifunctional nuclease family protein [Acidimicrobiales bacterium]